MSCEATPRKSYQASGWECDGTNLVQVMTMSDGLPVVAPASEIERVMRRPGTGSYDPQPFTGGEHVHLVLPKETVVSPVVTNLAARGYLPHVVEGDNARPARYGWSLTLDIENCNPILIDDARVIRSWLRGYGVDGVGGLVEQIGMTPHGDPWIESFAHDDPVTSGYTAVQLIETSSITAHFSPYLRTAHIDVFSCRSFDPAVVLDATLGAFGTADSYGRATFLPRG